LEDFRKIIDDCISGDNRAPEKLYRKLAPKMFGVCLRYAKDKTEAEDNLHDGFVTVFSKLRDFRHEGSFEGWVRRIMVNVSLNRYRQKQHLVLIDEVRHLDAQISEEEVLGNLPVEDLVKIIQELPPAIAWFLTCMPLRVTHTRKSAGNLRFQKEPPGPICQERVKSSGPSCSISMVK